MQDSRAGSECETHPGKRGETLSPPKLIVKLHGFQLRILAPQSANVKAILYIEVNGL